MTGGDLLQEAVAELYSADPDEFVARRGELAARARTAGEAALAKRIGALRKPTRSAWVVNRLVRADPSVAGQLETLGAELRAAQQSFDGPALRELSRQRRRLIDALARQAFSVSGQKSPPAGLREEVASTLGAALADPQVAEELRAGALARAVSRDGLETTVQGLPAEWSPGERSPGTARPGAGAARRKAEPEDGRPEDGQREDAGREDAGRRDGMASKVVPLPSARRRAPGRAGAMAPDRPAAKVTALAAARAKAERAQAERVKAERQRQRQVLAAAKQAVKQAEQGARAAAKVEQDQQNALQLLEEQLAGARQQLTEARIRAQRARTIQRQAQRALDRLLRSNRGDGEA